MNNPKQNIAFHIPLARCEHAQSQIEFLCHEHGKNKTPDFIVVNGVIYSRTNLRARNIIFQTESYSLSGKRKRVILSTNKRERLWFAIDERFQKLSKAEPNLRKYQIYKRISEHSVEWLAIFLGPRQIEGKHASYERFLRNRRAKEQRF